MAGITPASGYLKSYYAALSAVIIVLGAYLGIYVLKEKLRIDDALDVSSVHGLTGVIGSLAIGFFADKSVNPAGADGWVHGNFRQVWVQMVGVGVALAWSGVVTLVLAFLLQRFEFFKMVVSEEIEDRGLDFYYHGHVAYDELETPAEHREYGGYAPIITHEYHSTHTSASIRSSVGNSLPSEAHVQRNLSITDSKEASGGLSVGVQRKRVLSARSAQEIGEFHV
eukprot:TRINITY_DN1057_c0_g1_i1.p1 TRINITY_DN1057_c0_g1~~TRINITY_DN1057_c0_g1_i1.p1  ORF type:complete len:225 (+),score=65.07 TRINITY_DN1057_c0_g1_i1:1260-1934(+)